jgi:hypothetical protein
MQRITVNRRINIFVTIPPGDLKHKDIPILFGKTVHEISTNIEFIAGLFYCVYYLHDFDVLNYYLVLFM